MSLSVILDTCTLFPFGLRDLLLRCALNQLFTPRWTQDILTELSRNLIKDAGFSPERTNRLLARMHYAFPNALITGYQYLIPRMTNHSGDRHVLAAAVHTGTGLIVTSNLKHFPVSALSPYRVSAQSPDQLLCDLVTEQPTTMARIVQQQAHALDNPPISVRDLVASLGLSVPTFAKVMPAHLLAEQL